MTDRLRARIVTGRLGHLYGGVADWFELVGKLLAARVRRGRPGRSRRPGRSDGSGSG